MLANGVPGDQEWGQPVPPVGVKMECVPEKLECVDTWGPGVADDSLNTLLKLWCSFENPRGE